MGVRVPLSARSNVKNIIMLYATELRNGVVFKYEGKTWVVLKFEFIKMGRGSGTVKIKAKDVISGAIVERGFSQQMRFEEASIQKSSVQFLYKDEKFAYFMDVNTFDQIEIPLDSIEDSIKFIVPGSKVICVFLDSQPISIEIPKSVNLKVIYTEPAVKGDTSNNPTKKAILESGLEMQVPLFIETGDILKINTETGEYIERLSK